jgi:hypothetical protein
MKIKMCAALLLALPVSAMAGFQISNGTVPLKDANGREIKPVATGSGIEVEKVGGHDGVYGAQAPSVSASGAVVYKNYKSNSARFAQGMGRDVALGLAVSQILQSSDWEIKAESMVNMKKAVAWTGGAPWTEVLDDVLSQAGYSAEVDGLAKTVTIYARSTPLELRLWELDPRDGSLKRALSKWASAAGWQLAWESPHDFPVAMYARLEGSFEDAVVSVSKSLKASDHPLRVVFYEGNRVVRVIPADGGKRQ